MLIRCLTETDCSPYNISMNQVDPAVEVIRRLCKGESRDGIITHLCHLEGWSWERANSFVNFVQKENALLIARKRFPMISSLAIVIYIAGLMLVGYGFYGIYVIFLTPQGGTPDDLTSYFMPVIESGVNPIDAIFPAFPAYLRYALYIIFSPAPAIILGFSMLIGSLIGMKKIWSEILPD